MKRFFNIIFLLVLTGCIYSSEKPNIILILADDLGYGDLGVYGCKDIKTPNLDKIAQSGIMLTNAYVSAPYCGPSRAGLMTGRYQQRHGFYNNPSYRPNNSEMGLDTNELTLADVLKMAGYKTAAFGKWHLGASNKFHPNNRGFDEFGGFLGGGHNYFPSDYRKNMKNWSKNLENRNPEVYQYSTPIEYNGVDLELNEGYLTDILTDFALGFINRYESRPFFIYLAYNAPHTPLQAPEKDIAEYANIKDEKRRIYAAMVSNMDRNIGRILKKLEENKIKDNTLIVFLSDNGGPVRLGANNGALKGGKGQMWEGGVRVPFIISWPEGLPADKVLNQSFSSLDLLPTFAAAAGISNPVKKTDGKNILPYLRAETDKNPHEVLYWENDHTRGMRYGNMKIVKLRPEKPWYLSDLEKDINESVNLARRKPEEVRKMDQMYQKWYNSLAPVRWLDPGK